MSPRFILFIIGGVLIYLTLSFYHGHKLKQLPDRIPGNISTSASEADQGKNWVQVTTSEEENDPNSAPRQTTGKPEHRADLPEEVVPKVVLPSGNRDNDLRQQLHTAGEEQTKLQQALIQEQKKNQQLVIEKENLLFKIKALQATLQGVRVQFQTKEGELQNNNARQIQELDKIQKTTNETDSLKRSVALKSEALNKANKRIDFLAKRLQDSSTQILDSEKVIKELNISLAREQKTSLQAHETAGRLQNEVNLSREEKEQRLAEVGRLQTQLKKMKSRLILIEGEVDRARLKAEAMLRYGQEQTKLITPFRQEIEILNGRLQDANSRLLEGEQAIAEFEETEWQLRQQVTDLEAKQRTNQEQLARLTETEQLLAESSSREEELTVMLKELASQLNEKEALIASLNQSVAASQAAALESGQQATVSQGESASLREALDEMGNRTQSVQKQLDEALLTRDGLKTQLQKVEKQSSDLAELSNHQEQQLQTAERTAADLKKSLQKKSAALLKLEARKKKKTAAIKELKQKLSGAEKRTDQVEARLQKVQKASVDKSMIKEREKMLEDLRTKMASLEQQLAAQKQQLEKTAALVSGQKEENRQLREQLQQVQGQSKELQTQAQELTETKKLLAELQEDTATLKSELDLRERSYFTMQEELSSLQVQHDQLLQQTTDSDNDGIPDSDDTCPDTAGNAEVDSRGCESDSDGDGLVNRLDLCPDSPADTDIDLLGCLPEQPVILHGVRFASGTAKLTPEATPSLDKVIMILQQYPALTFEIGGHTDSIGEEKRNLTVSRKRAEAVAAYLIDHGIHSDRITARGYGPEHPVADNDSPAGRTDNRRVELKIIPPPATEPLSQR